MAAKEEAVRTKRTLAETWAGMPTVEKRIILGLCALIIACGLAMYFMS